jgi:hypothetical protein
MSRLDLREYPPIDEMCVTSAKLYNTLRAEAIRAQAEEDRLTRRVEALEHILTEIANCECMECSSAYIANEALGVAGGEK